MKNIYAEQVRGLIDWGQAGAPPPSNPCFEVASIIIVGGRLSSAEGSLSFSDSMKIVHLAGLLVDHGVRFSEDVQMRVCNLEYGDDFIRDVPTADCLIYSWVNKDVDNVSDPEVGGTSPLLKLGHTWKEAIREANAPLIAMATDNSTCIGFEDVPKKSYDCLNPAEATGAIAFPVFRHNDLAVSRPRTLEMATPFA